MENLMKKMFKKKQGGFAITAELVFLVTIGVIGLTVAMVDVRDALHAEMDDVAESIGSLDQSYAFDGILNEQGTAEVAGSSFGDNVDATSGDGIDWTFTPPSATELNATISLAPDASAAGATVDGTQN
jgi:hypothetical protein